MNTRIIVPVTWTLWGIPSSWCSTGSCGCTGVHRTSSPDAWRGVAVAVVLFILVPLAGAAMFLTIAAQRQWTKGLVTMAVILGWPLVSLVVSSLMRAFKSRQFAAAESRVGDFKDVALASMARAITANDSVTLTQLLGGKRPPEGKDRAGHTLLAYAALVVRDRDGRSGPMRALLAAGADPRKTKMPTGENVVTFLIHGHTPAAHDAMRALLEHGGDANVADPQTGNTPLGEISDDADMVRSFVENGADIDRVQSDGTPAVVRFIGTRQWDSALYLIEKGATLDVVNHHGLSVGYYLNDWKESVFGEHPEGWDKVREAIATRRTASPA
jgi:hypothetical protein